METRKAYPSDVSDVEWAFVAPYLCLIRPDAPQRQHDLREIYNGLRWIVRTGSPAPVPGATRYMPNDLPPWEAVYQQTRRWIKSGVFEQMAHDLRSLLRRLDGRFGDPSAVILDSRTLQSSVESGERAGYDGAKKKKGSKLHLAVDTMGHLLALVVTPANEQDRDQVGKLLHQVQQASGERGKVAFADQGYTGEKAHAAAQEEGVELVVVKLDEAKRGFVLLPRRWVRRCDIANERSFGWMTRFRRLVRDYERLARTLEGMHLVAFVSIMLGRLLQLVLSLSA